jgi:type II secretory pathway pseudopilin PulG
MGKHRKAFSLIELLVIVAILAAVIGILIPTLGSVRAQGRDVRCLTNLRSIGAAWQLYGVDNDDRTPALGVPWSESPNWAIVVAQYSGLEVATAAQLPVGESSVLVCPATQRRNAAVDMTRTYGANVTGFSGAEGDRGDFDEAPTFARFGRVRFPGRTPMVLDSAAIAPGPNLPPPARTASVIDFREPSHVEDRIGRVHGGPDWRGAFHVAFYDGSANRRDEVDSAWASPINE